MTLTIIPFPSTLFGRGEVNFRPLDMTRSGGQPTNGDEQIILSAAGRWGADAEFQLQTNAQILAARALLLRLRGGAGVVSIPACDAGRAPWPYDAYGRRLDPGYVRRTLLDNAAVNEWPVLDGTAYQYPAIPTVSNIIASAAAAAVRATQLVITVTQGSAPSAGMMFTIGTRLYAIDEIRSVAAGAYTVGIWPELREAVASSTAVNFTRPVCPMKLASDDAGEMALIKLKYGALTLDLLEAFG